MTTFTAGIFLFRGILGCSRPPLRNSERMVPGVLMARSDLLISLVKAGTTGDRQGFQTAAEAIIAEERAKHHGVLADRLAKAIRSNGHQTSSVRWPRFGGVCNSGVVCPSHPPSIQSLFFSAAAAPGRRHHSPGVCRCLPACEKSILRDSTGLLQRRSRSKRPLERVRPPATTDARTPPERDIQAPSAVGARGG